MKSIINIISIIFLIISVGFTDKLVQSNDSESINSTGKLQINRGIIKDDEPFKKGDKLTHDQLYSKGETMRGIFTRLVSDSLTMKKLYIANRADGETHITVFYQNYRIICAVHRNTSIDKEMISNSIFDFDEINNCISNTKWDKINQMEYTNSMYWDSLVRFDVNYNKIDLTPSEKQQIIQSTKASLDSIMQHFPEFKYSMNWK